eukprot:SAG31_NODE_1282_length_9017_cov_10.333146_2_plen_249_part_00
MGCFDRFRWKGEEDEDWQDFANPVAEPERKSTLSQGGSKGGSKGVSAGGTFDMDASRRIGTEDDAQKKKEKLKTRSGKSKDFTDTFKTKSGSTKVGSFEDEGSEDFTVVETLASKSKSSDQHTDRLNKQMRHIRNKALDGVQEDEFKSNGEVKNEYLEQTDWETEHNIEILRREAKARKIATHGRALAYSKQALQNALNKYDERERMVNVHAAQLSSMTWDSQRDWRNRKGDGSAHGDKIKERLTKAS